MQSRHWQQHFACFPSRYAPEADAVISSRSSVAEYAPEADTTGAFFSESSAMPGSIDRPMGEVGRSKK